MAVRSAERMRGTLVPCGPGLRPIGWPDTPNQRAFTLVPWLVTDHIVVSEHTAAWVWGATSFPGRPLTFVSTGGTHVTRTDIDEAQYREFHIPEEEILELAGVRVTTLTRTVCDLLRSPNGYTPGAQRACRILLSTDRRRRQEVRDELEAHARLPYHRRALIRLAGLDSSA